MSVNRAVLLGLVATICGGIVLTFSGDRGLAGWSGGEQLSAIDNAPEWLNSEPLRSKGLEGKVVLVHFWTYSCVNWLRTQPYIRAWAEKYKDDGLVVIGVHTPEFSFEKEFDNVVWATGHLDVKYPVVTDNEFRIWRAFGNNYWPAFYFIDATGRVRHEKFGEGDYDQSERWIQELLKEAGADVNYALTSLEPVGLEAAADWSTLGSSETYVGAARSQNFASPGGTFAEIAHDYTAPDRLGLNQWALSGDWTVASEAISLNEPGGLLSCRFRARDLNLVMGPEEGGEMVRFRVLIDGEPPGAAHGVDVDDQGFGVIEHQRLFQLVRQPAPIAERLFEIQFIDAGAQAFSFTFG